MNRIFNIPLFLAGLAAFFPIESWGGASPQHDSLVFQFYFRHADDLLVKNYRGNRWSLEILTNLLAQDSVDRISLVSITGSSSPDGNIRHNEALALARAKAVEAYIHWKAPWFDRQLIRVSADTDFCTTWLRAVEQDTLIPRRTEVLEILRSEAPVATKWANVQLLSDNPARYLQRNVFPLLRNSVACVVRPKHTQISPMYARDTISAVPATPLAPVPAFCDTCDREPCGLPETTVVEGIPSAPSEMVGKPLLALKTNLLFDAATMLNLELEVPIGQRWSVAGEWICPWWLWNRKQHCLQMMSGNIEGKYWFGNRLNRPQMTGWFAGLYAGGGYYDLEWDKTGYQGEFFIALGASGGYAHTINKSGTLRMEYTLGIGYMQTDYRSYEAKIGSDDVWHLYRRESGTYKWFGPTRLKVSLVWMLNHNKKGGSAR